MLAVSVCIDCFDCLIQGRICIIHYEGCYREITVMFNKIKWNIKHRRRWIRVVMLCILVAVCVGGAMHIYNTKKLIDEKKDIDKAYVSAMDMISQGLNVDYTKLSDEDKIYYFTLITEGIGGAKLLYKNTSYNAGGSVQNLTLTKLQTYMNKQYLSDFVDFRHSQMDIYNLVGNICLDLNSTVAIEELYEYLNNK